jgi:hypothetical protein
VPGIDPAAPLAFPADTTLRAVAIESYLTINGMNISGTSPMKGADGASTLRRALVDIDSCNTCRNLKITSSNVFAGFPSYTGESRYCSQESKNLQDRIHSIHAGAMRKANNPSDPFDFVRDNPNATGGNGPIVSRTPSTRR